MIFWLVLKLEISYKSYNILKDFGFLWQLQNYRECHTHTYIVYAFFLGGFKILLYFTSRKETPQKKKKVNYCQTIAYSAGPRCFFLSTLMRRLVSLALPPPWGGLWGLTFFTFFFILFIHS